MPWKPPIHRPLGWRPAKRERRDLIDRAYGTQAWRKLAAAVVTRDGGVCHVCGQPGADTAHHLSRGGTAAPTIQAISQPYIAAVTTKFTGARAIRRGAV